MVVAVSCPVQHAVKSAPGNRCRRRLTSIEELKVLSNLNIIDGLGVGRAVGLLSLVPVKKLLFGLASGGSYSMKRP